LILTNEGLVKKSVKATVKGTASKKPAKSRVVSSSNWRDVLLTTDEAGAAVKMTGERVRQLTKEGWIRKGGPNSYRLGDVIDGILAYREDQAKKIDADSEQSKLAASRRREIDLRIAREQNKLIEITEVIEATDDVFGVFCSELRSLPAATTRDLTVRAEIERVLTATMQRCSEKIESRRTDLHAGRGIVHDDEPDDD
jgi:hypothetical protein